jgi:GNAT superfamily N-acetyltransferase
MKILVRQATPDDAALLAVVEVTSWQAAYRELMPPAFLEGLSREQKTADWRANLLKHGPLGRKRVLVAVADAEVTGFVRVGAEREEREIGLIYLLYVLPTYWGRGVGTVLMHAALEELRDLGLRESILWVLRDNLRARGFYERLGWCQDGRTTTEEYGGIELEALCYRRAVETRHTHA